MSKVVVLDDNAEMRAIVSEIALFLGHEVRAFERVGPFIESVEREPADKVIVDAVLLEDCTGLEVIEQVRRIPGMEDSDYILMTASPAYSGLEKRLKESHIGLLTKPCEFEALEMALV